MPSGRITFVCKRPGKILSIKLGKKVVIKGSSPAGGVHIFFLSYRTGLKRIAGRSFPFSYFFYVQHSTEFRMHKREVIPFQEIIDIHLPVAFNFHR